ncbi:protein GFS12 isoform X1 [Telopea speciosissima]|uniref:protein GFS12 isoform X1 n=1 Tax=Telopea speciosissima TaxID=54955 RepID=UPI001CC7262D|nr:protein GFS12 isoform X1 [Telopea speciosissima]
MENQLCFECLQRHILTDFSDKLIFCYGLSDSALPLGSRAVIQLPNSNGEIPAQFELVCVPRHEDECFTRYVDEYSLENLEASIIFGLSDIASANVGQDPENVNDGAVGSKTVTLHSVGNMSECSLNFARRDALAGEQSNGSGSSYLGRFSCLRTITALAPIAHVGLGSYSMIEDLACNFLSGSVEGHILSSLILFIEGKPTGRDGVNFLSLVGLPSFDENNIPGCVRHPNITPVLGMLKTPGYVNLLLPKSPYTLENILHYCPDVLRTEWHIRFLIYQILSALAYIHGLGVAHGDICPSSVMLSNSCWSWLSMCDKPLLRGKLSSGKWNMEMSCLNYSSSMSSCTKNCACQALYADLKLSPTIDWFSDCFKRWWQGDLSNYEYLLVLNRLAGRRWGDHTFHTVMPWVIDFSVKPDENTDAGWRDLCKSKWRLAKGDEQLDFTYSTSEIPHHVSDECLSELAVCSYKARRLPLSVLRMAVRSVYEPNEYPSNMQRVYQWTPDECIPEFYSDPRIFTSLHSGMSDLAVPSWANSPEDFIKLHRDALESNRVSREIHHWIDITFGYKMSGQAALAAKNVMLTAIEPTLPRSMGRRQLFTRSHPRRRAALEPCDVSEQQALLKCQTNGTDKSILSTTAYLQELEEATSFCEHAWHLSPHYHYHQRDLVKNVSSVKESQCENSRTEMLGTVRITGDYMESLNIDINSLLEYFESDDGDSMGFQELLLWKHKLSSMGRCSLDVADDIFSVGCILAELYLKRPLFSSSSLAAYVESGILPQLMQELPPHAAVLVEACIQRDWQWRPSAKCLLQSPYFPSTVRSSYLFLAPLHLLAKDEYCLQYAANFARQGALKAMGSFAAEMCAPYCLSHVLPSLSDTEAEWAFSLLKEFLQCLKPQAVKTLIVPAIQKILQATDYSHLKVSFLQDSFVRELWKRIGKQTYLETIHPLVISNLCISPHKNSASAASVLLIGSSEELGVPVTVHQTILPLIHCFGKGLCPDGIDVLVRIGGLFGENFVVKQLLPLLRNVILSCVDVSNVDKPEPMQSWNTLALIDSLVTLDGLVALLPRDVIIKELIQDKSCLHVKVLMQTHLDLPVLQVAATALVAVCQRIGPDLTALHVLPQLKELFDELAFSQERAYGSSSVGRSLKVSRPKQNEDAQIESRMDLVLLLYPPFASLLGIEKLRQCCATWLLLEQFLQRSHNWKTVVVQWEYIGETSRSSSEYVNAQRPVFRNISTSEYNPAKLLLNGVGWSIPQSQGVRGSKNLFSYKQSDDLQKTPDMRQSAALNLGKREPWFWFPSPAASWNGPDFLGRIGGLKDELPWKIRASIIYSVRAHPGALRSLAVTNDEYTVFTGGVGPGFKGTVQKWELSRMDRVSGYYGHEEVVNDICILSSSGRVASCDGTIHVWNSQTGKLISAYAEPSANSSHLVGSRIGADQANMLNSNTLSGGILTSAFGGSLYTCMHYLESVDKLVAGTGNGSLRFIDVARDQKLHLWKSESVESSFSSLVSAISSCGSDKIQDRTPASTSWIAAGLSSGHCRLLDARSGSVVAFWQAHDGYITKLSAPEDHLLVSSSLDKTLRVWDLRRNWPSQSNVYNGHSDGVSGFCVWGQDVISIARNKIGLFSLSRCGDEQGGQQRILSQKLYTADRGTRNLSVLSSINILPFSRLFLVGTEDGYLKICC